MKYRPDIDGLRALAVVSVMCYHLSPHALPGGFTGVDVFFAISGFVVCASLADSKATTLRSYIGEFYSRRLARIIPALVAMLMVTSVAATLFIPRAWLSSMNERTALFAFIGLSNWALATNADTYFAPRAEANPYLHTWSLGVEEQFYLVFPIICFLWVRSRGTARQKRAAAATALLALLGLASLAASAWASRAKPNAAFFEIQFRFWELAAGALLFQATAAMTPSERTGTSRWRQVGPWLGVLLVGVGVAFTNAAAFPFPWAAAPVIGTLLLIGGADADVHHSVRRFFASRWPVWIGKRSYSLYLWHWPVYVLLRWTAGLSAEWKIAAVVATVSLAILSYQLVEMPLRHNATLFRFPALVQIAAFLAMVGIGWRFTDGVLWRTDSWGLSVVGRNAREWYAEPGAPLEVPGSPPRRCPVSGHRTPLLQGVIVEYRREKCDGPPADTAARVIVLGDSHAIAYLPALEEFAAETGIPVDIYSLAGCPFLDLRAPMTDSQSAECVEFSRTATRFIVADGRAGDVLFLASLRQRRFADETTNADNPRDLMSARTPTSIELTRQATAEAVEWLRPLAERGIAILFEAPTPIFRSPPFRCSDWFNASNPVCRGGMEEPRAYLDSLRMPIVSAMRDISRQLPGVRVWDPLPELCHGETCSTFLNGHPLFFDNDHITRYANAQLYPSLKDAVIASRTSRTMARMAFGGTNTPRVTADSSMRQRR